MTDQMPPVPSLDDIITKGELAKRLGIQWRSLSRYRYKHPRLPYLRVGKGIYFSKTQIGWWLTQHQAIPDLKMIEVMRAKRELQRNRGM